MRRSAIDQLIKDIDERKEFVQLWQKYTTGPVQALFDKYGDPTPHKFIEGMVKNSGNVSWDLHFGYWKYFAQSFNLACKTGDNTNFLIQVLDYIKFTPSLYFKMTRLTWSIMGISRHGTSKLILYFIDKIQAELPEKLDKTIINIIKYSRDPSIEPVESWTLMDNPEKPDAELIYFIDKNYKINDSKVKKDRRILKKYILSGDLKLVQWFVERFNLTKDYIFYYDYHNEIGDPGILQLLARKDENLCVIQWLVERFQIDDKNIFTDSNCALYNALCVACASGSNKIVEWIIEKFNVDNSTIKNDSLFLAIARMNRRYDIIKLLVEKRVLISEDFREKSGNFCSVCGWKKLEHIQWAVETFKFDINDIKARENKAFIEACNGGNLEIVKWLVENFNLDREFIVSHDNIIFVKICEYGSLEVIEWLADTFHLTSDDMRSYRDSAFILACKRGNSYEVVEWLVKRLGYNLDDHARVILGGYKQIIHEGKISEWIRNKFKLENILIKPNPFSKK